MVKGLYKNKNEKVIAGALDRGEQIQFSVVTMKIEDDTSPEKKWKEIDLDEILSTGYDDTDEFYDKLTDMHDIDISNYIDDFEVTDLSYDNVTKHLSFRGIFLDRDKFQIAMIVAVFDDTIYPLDRINMVEEIDADDDDEVSNFFYESTFLNVGD